MGGAEEILLRESPTLALNIVCDFLTGSSRVLGLKNGCCSPPCEERPNYRRTIAELLSNAASTVPFYRKEVSGCGFGYPEGRRGSYQPYEVYICL